MMKKEKDIIAVKKPNARPYRNQYTSCIILTHDNQILLQLRGPKCFTFPGCISAFGGQIEKGETPLQAIIRELQEELGANVKRNELKPMGVITESITKHQDCVYHYFWHDKENKITGCYEEKPIYFNNVNEALKHPKIMEDVRFALTRCQTLHLLK